MSTSPNLSPKKLTGLFLMLLCSTFTGLQTNAQTGAWNTNTFSFTKDTSSLENMVGATNVTFTGVTVESSSSISFGGFNFRFGLSSYNNFYVSPFGFIKLGSSIVSNNPEQNSDVIVPLNNGTVWGASYKIAGTAPNRKMVVQFTGVMQPSGEPTSFQVWLHERTGKIQFVYERLRGYYGYSSSQRYRIFCATDILKARATASIRVNPNNSQPSISYTGVGLSNDSIYAKTRFTFQPDTIKPANLTSLNFTDVQAGCLTVNISENATNESVVVLERADTNTNYKIEKLYYVTAPVGNTTYNYAQTLLQPFWNYNYRCFVTNGFLSSDTLYNTIQTLMPQLSGVKTVPGDYPSITALLQDAPCKHIGPDIIIELQNNYSFAAETLPLTFGPSIRNRLIHSITVRPAANTIINWTAAFSGPLFYVDSVCHVFLDGRSGGTGTSQNLILTQNGLSGPVIQYTNAADSGGINYCKIIKRSNAAPIVVVPNDYTYTRSKKDINAFSITNNFISVDTNTTNFLIYIKPADTLNAKDFIISGNQFSRFRRSAIHFEGGGENLLISNNRFFQPIAFTPEIFLPYTDASCITLINTGKTIVDNNYFGGSDPAWGTGKFKMNSFNDNYSFINYQNNSMVKKAFITNNKFGNIEIATNTSSYTPKLIYLKGGDVLVDSNKFGTADSINSITYAGFFWGVDMMYGTKTLSNNFFSGIQGRYLNSNTSNSSYFFTTAFTDSAAFINNDIGGSDNPGANSSTGDVYGIYTVGHDKMLVIKGNNIHGISSRGLDVNAISCGAGVSTGLVLTKLEIDSNSVHHIVAAKRGNGILVSINSKTSHRISYNNIYALKTQGIVPAPYSLIGSLYGIYYNLYNDDTGPENYKGEVAIYGNKIHSFESLRSLSNSVFTYYGLVVTCPLTKIYNNEIRFGINNRGQFIDSVTTLNGIVIQPADNQTRLADKHYIEHNTIYFGGEGSTVSAIAALYPLNYPTDKGSVTVDNNIINIERTPLPGSFFSSGMYQKFQSIKVYSAKNIWYSSTIPNTPSYLQSFKQSCGCDSSSFVGNPMFVNAMGDSSNYSLHLGPLSQADAAGTPSVLPITTDLDSINRNTHSPVDIGCYAATPCGNGVFPSITITNPLSDSVLMCSGVPLTLTGSVSGGQFTSLQWQRNLIDSVGATDTTITVNRIGNYRLVGKTACGVVASRLIYVEMNLVLPYVAIIATATSVCRSVPVTFTATIINITNPVYQWRKNNVNISNATSAIYTTSTLNSYDTITCVVTGNTICPTINGVSSNKIRMIINPLPNLGTDTTLYLNCPGNTANLNTLYNTAGLTASWITNTLSNTPFTLNAAPAGTYRLIVSNIYGCSDTAFATIKLEVATWLGGVSNDWHTPANWSINKVPTNKTHVIVPNNTVYECVVSAANAQVASIQLRNGAVIRLNNGVTITVVGICATLPPG